MPIRLIRLLSACSQPNIVSSRRLSAAGTVSTRSAGTLCCSQAPTQDQSFESTQCAANIVLALLQLLSNSALAALQHLKAQPCLDLCKIIDELLAAHVTAKRVGASAYTQRTWGGSFTT